MARVHVSCDLCGCNDASTVAVSEGFPIVKCRQCGHLFTSPRPTDDELRERYASGRWREEVETPRDWLPEDSSAWHVWAEAHRFVRLKAVFTAVPPPASLLEVGCGYGDLLATLSIHGYSVHGIELDEDAAAAASRLIGGDRVSREPIERFPGSEAFDCLTAFAVLEHVTSPTSFMQSAARLLKPGGYVILHVPNALYLLSRTRLLGSANWQVPDGHIHHFTMGSLGRLLTSTGFEIVSQFWHGHPYIPRSRGALPRWRASTVSHAKQVLWMATGQRANLSPSLNIVARKRPTGSTGS